MTPHSSTAARVAEQAAAWLVRLDSEDADEREAARLGFDAWQAADPSHAQAAQRLQAFVAQVRQIGQGAGGDGHAAHAALDAAHARERQSRRRRTAARLGGSLALVLALAIPSWLAVHSHPPAHLLADLRSHSGQWVQHRLDDGSVVTLSGLSAINWHFDKSSRVVELVRGSLLVDVARDAARPFYVQTPLGSIRALGTRFVVRYDDAGMTLEMLESRVAVQPGGQQPQGAGATIVQAGQRLHMDSGGRVVLETLDIGGVEQGWRQHQLVVDDRPLPEVLDQLARHHPGPMRFDRQALSQLRISGVLPLDDTARALRLLQRNFPEMRVRSLAGRWVWIDLQPAS
ncbi:FecR family protein [Delftia sp. PS-11]|uniref:FecR family protein n=1 Tax=Delftia sp. PS-11 TaxID=2767222 RepID=UPI002456E208|nr:FecR domain-containing protein [Delftia sp. PS-11]KAJ8744052.1 FecR domain-containing protein [Delftia sp. PS-11]